MIQVSRNKNSPFRIRVRRLGGCLMDGGRSIGAFQADDARPGHGLEHFGDKDSIVPGRHAMTSASTDQWNWGYSRDQSWGSKDDSFPSEPRRATTYGESGRQVLGLGKGPDEGVLQGGQRSAKRVASTEPTSGDRFTMNNGLLEAAASHLQSPMRCGPRGRNDAV